MKISLFIFFVLLINSTWAQQSFLIYQVKGNVKLKKSSGSLRIGQILKSDNELELDKGAAVLLICEGYHSFTINKPGVHLLRNYIDSCTSQEYSVSGRYFEYIWEEFTHPHSSPETNRRKYMQNTGAVVRGCPGISIDPMYDTLYNHTGDVKIKWKTSLPNKRLTFVLFDGEKNGLLLYSIAVDNNYVHLDTIRKLVGINEEVYWNITIDGNEMCSRKYIKFWKIEDYSLFKTELTKTLNTISNKAERSYAFGFMLEANHFIAEAKKYYSIATALNTKEIRYRLPLNELH